MFFWIVQERERESCPIVGSSPEKAARCIPDAFWATLHTHVSTGGEFRLNSLFGLMNNRKRELKII